MAPSPITPVVGTNTSGTQGAAEAAQAATEKNLLANAAETPTALAAIAEATATECSATKPTTVTGFFEGKTATRTAIEILVGGVAVMKDVQSVAATGVGINNFTFKVPAGAKWEWKKVEGTLETNGFKVSYVIGG